MLIFCCIYLRRKLTIQDSFLAQVSPGPTAPKPPFHTKTTSSPGLWWYLERGEHHVEPFGNEGRHQTVPLPVLNRKTVKFGVFRQHQVYSNSAFWRQRRVFLGTWNKWELDWFMLIKCSILNVKSPSLDTVFNVSKFLKFKISFRKVWHRLMKKLLSKLLAHTPYHKRILSNICTIVQYLI